ncbi:MAG TPA: DUF1015 domain-containing protein, partial [Balneolaceae bacterium]|nr:DUF1015 domain-containing protein [Balneolaceae bacterium]
MAIVKPFKAWRPKPEFAPKVVSVPYDVINTTEALELAEGKPNSYLHVIRPEIDLPKNTSVYDESVYVKGSENLSKLLQTEVMLQEDNEALYIYRLEMDGRTQTGFFGCVSVEDYNNERIVKHELTRPDKEDDRTKHIITQEAHPEPVMLTFRDSENISSSIDEFVEGSEPIYDLTTEDDITHTIWKVEKTSSYVEAFARIQTLYIADGHHRCASAARAAEKFASQNPEHTGNESYNFFPAVIFPTEQLHILAYNRVVLSIPDNFLELLGEKFEIQKKAKPTPPKKGMISLYLNDNWYGISLKAPRNDDPVSELDVSLLQDQILEPMLGIKDQRTDPNIDFVGGIRGTDELEKLVDNGEAAM